MNIELKPIAESKVRQLGGDVCGVLVRNEAGAWAAVSEGGRVMWLDDFEGQPSSAQGGRGADAVKWSDPAVDPIVSKLYRKFKEWNRQGFGADDVTWCEVRGYVAELLNAQPQPDVPEALTRLRDAWRAYEATVDTYNAKVEEARAEPLGDVSVGDEYQEMHEAKLTAIQTLRNAADAVDALLSTPTTPQADGWVRCDERLPTEEDWWVWIYDSEDSDIFHALWRDLKGDYENGHMNLSHWTPTGLKRPQPPKEDA